MSKVKNLNAPIGWLIDPHDKWAIHFDFKSLSNDDKRPDFNIDMWGVLPSGKPMEFKSRRKVTEKESIKIWKQLIASNWSELDIKKMKMA